MKHKKVLAAMAILAALPLTLEAGSQINITRQTKEIANTKDYNQVRNELGISHTYTNHDDSVATRTGNSGINGSVYTSPNRGNAGNSLSPINCNHAAYKSLCKELRDYVDQNAVEPEPKAPKGWVTVYNNGAGTRSISTGNSYQFAQWRMSYKWLENGTTWRSAANVQGNTNSSVSISASKGGSASRKCGGDWYRVSAYATATVSIRPQVSFGAPSNKSISDQRRSGCVTAYATATISNVAITKFEVYYQ